MKHKNSNIVEHLLDNSLVMQDFMQEMFGEGFDYSFDTNTKTDLDMERNTIKKEQIILEIENVKEETIKSIEENSDELEKKIKEWAKRYDLNYYYDTIYTSEDGITIVFDIPEESDKWDGEKHAAEGLEISKKAINSISSVLMKLKDIDGLKEKMITEYTDSIVEMARESGDEELNEFYVLLDAIEKITKEAKATIKEETIDYIEKTKDDMGLGTLLLVEEKISPKYDEDKVYYDENKKLKAIQNVIDIRKKKIMATVKKEIEEGKETTINYTTTKLIRPYYDKKAEDGVEVESEDVVKEGEFIVGKKSKITNPKYKMVDSMLKAKYGVVCEDMEISEEDFNSKFNQEMSENDIIDKIVSEYELTPISPEKDLNNNQKTKVESYICRIKDARGTVIGTYEVSYKDDDYVKMFLETMGVKLKNGDKIDFE